MSDQPHEWHRAPLGLDSAEGYRAEVCAWLTAAMPGAPADPRDRTGFAEEFERALLADAGRRGLLRPDIAPECAAVFAYEVAYHDAPLVDTGVVLAAAPLRQFGSADRQAELLPGMTEGTDTWCIAYTEADAGNDLMARITTSAVPDGEGWRLDGAKCLVTGGAKADRCLTIARTGVDACGRAELTMFTLPMDTRGVRVRRRPTIAGYTLDEIHFEDVRLGPEAVVGTVGQGRRQLAAAVQAEHGALFHAGWVDRMLHEFAAWCRDAGAGVGALAADTLGALWARGAAAREVALRPVREPAAPMAPAMAKVMLTELLQEIAHRVTELAGPAGARLGSVAGPAIAGAPWGGRFAYECLFRVDGPVSVGANELHRDGVARWALADPAAAILSGAAMPEEQDPPAPAVIVKSLWKDGLSVVEVRRLLAVAEARAAAGKPSVVPLVLGRLLCGADDGRTYVGCDGGPEVAPGPVIVGGRVEGRVPGVPAPVLYGDPSGLRLVVVAAGPSGPEVVLVDATAEGVRHEPVPGIGPHPSGDLVLAAAADGTPIDPATVERARRLASLVVAAEATGAARAALGATLGRVAGRRAYGGVLSDLQAVRQRLADMVIDLHSAHAVLAAAAHDVGAANVHAAKAHVDDVACRTAMSAHRLCGGWGYLQQEGGPGDAYRTAKASTFLMGGTHWHRARLAAEVLGPAGRPGVG
ncbi:acyl-CoA dehydrogenase family protein [Yinghuangia sp. YIM S09857]|uniref:acyl-CoA dehydrogenase family protein n=1 Tax=Yinghuangia sp. YIM S09857 TaxID=3436929 RepID=UPI003F5348A2